VIVGSIVLVIVAAILLVVGLVRQNDALLYSSIVASALAALALLVGVRQFPASRLPEADFDVRSGGARLAPWPSPVGRASVRRQSRPGGIDITESITAHTDATTEGHDVRDGGLARVEDGADMADADQASLAEADDDIPADEPDEGPVTDQESIMVARLATEVLVIDGRPRYHVAECLHLLGRSVQRVPVREAVVLGFTPCAMCDPVARLLERG
jgi:hypothetical protein